MFDNITNCLYLELFMFDNVQALDRQVGHRMLRDYNTLYNCLYLYYYILCS
jgi:hypothetical protein